MLIHACKFNKRGSGNQTKHCSCMISLFFVWFIPKQHYPLSTNDTARKPTQSLLPINPQVTLQLDMPISSCMSNTCRSTLLSCSYHRRRHRHCCDPRVHHCFSWDLLPAVAEVHEHQRQNGDQRGHARPTLDFGEVLHTLCFQLPFCIAYALVHVIPVLPWVRI